ncbi:MAG: TolC family outer membrane protein [Rhodovibrionaceae bacterium]|nr:TolC family outer membrane protein [Rhodovibrionaceae bacterium]
MGNNKRSKVRLAAALAPFLALSALAAPAAGQTLDEALANAYRENPNLGAGRSELRAVNEQVPQALSGWRPQVTVNGAAGARKENQQSAFFSAQQDTNPVQLSLDVSQPIYRGGRTLADTARAEFAVQAQRARLKSITQEILLRAATAYMDVWRDQAVLGLNINNEKVLGRQLQATRDRFEVGEVTLTDVAQSESRLAAATAARVAAEGELKASQARFEEVIGLTPGVLTQPPPVADLPISRDMAIDAALADNPQVVAANFEEDTAEKRVEVVFGEFFPEASLDLRFARAAETATENSQVESAELTANIRIPLYQSGLVSSRVREAKQRLSQRRIEVEAVRRTVRQDTISAWEALTSARAQIESFEANVRAADIALDGVRQENAVGARTILDILDAEQELLDAQVNLVRAQRDEIVASFQVLSAVGDLTPQELELDVEAYDPADDYQAVRNRWLGTQAPGFREE